MASRLKMQHCLLSQVNVSGGSRKEQKFWLRAKTESELGRGVATFTLLGNANNSVRGEVEKSTYKTRAPSASSLKHDQNGMGNAGFVEETV